MKDKTTAECQEAHFSLTEDQELRRTAREFKVATTGIIDLTDPNEPVEEFKMTKGNLKDGKILQSLQYYAAKAMQAIIIGNKADISVTDTAGAIGVSKDAFNIADAMIAFEEEETKNGK